MVVVIGGANVDILARSGAPVVAGTSNPGATTVGSGGVARNVAENLARLGTRTLLLAAVGRDALGEQLLADTAAAGVDVSLVRRTETPTGTYTAVLDADGELVVAVADMAATDALTPDDVRRAVTAISSAALLVLDGNLAPGTVASAVDLAAGRGVPLVLEPVSVPKAKRLRPVLAGGYPWFAVTPNRAELAALTRQPVETDTQLGAAVDALHDLGVEHVWVRLGAEGSLLSSGAERVRLPVVPAPVVDVTGAGRRDARRLLPRPPVRAVPSGRRPPRPRRRRSHRRWPATPSDPTSAPSSSRRWPRGARHDHATPPLSSLTDEVAAALRDGGPVVALESTIISHGMPYPENVAMAREVEGIIRDLGVVPATIAVLDGRPRIGLPDDELELLGSSPDVSKVSIRDLPFVMAQGAHGATTVASTMRLAALAGIRVFVTGGLGGVHRGAQQSFDVSADLTELSTTDVAVVSAGVKSILDIGLTLETLETLGVPVLAVGTDEFPSFYSRSSGHTAPMRVDSAAEVAAVMRHKWDLGLRGGVVVASPIPAEDEIPADRIGAIIDRALADMDRLGIHGKDATPYLLGRIVEITGGESLAANIALVRNNARLGADIATAWSGISSVLE